MTNEDKRCAGCAARDAEVERLRAGLRFVIENVAVGPETRKRLRAALEAK